MFRKTTLWIGAALALASVAPVFAQDNQGGPPRGGRDGGRDSGRGFGRGGGSSRWLGASVEDLQKELNLTEDQRAKIDGIVKEVGDSIRARFEQARNNGGGAGGGFDAMRAEMEKTTTEALTKVKGVMTADQQEKYTKLVADRRAQAETRREEDRNASAERDVTRAMAALKIANAQEAEAVKSLVARVVKLQSDLREFDHSARDKVGETLRSDGIADEAVEQRLKGLRAERKALEDQLQKTQAELGKVVSAKQEAELFRQEILK
jgi:Spy/CpxP family protein refolding chaperone